MVPQKTAKAREELRPGVRTLGLRERRFLLLADGRKSVQDLEALFGAPCDALVDSLVAQGFLVTEAVQASGVAVGPMGVETTSFVVSVVPADPIPPVAVSAPPAVAADAFEGKRSLATTRMFLFDICERMFTRRDPVLATTLRDNLREARDRDTMLAVARLIIDEIERAAGAERADAISERIAMLLPPEHADLQAA